MSFASKTHLSKQNQFQPLSTLKKTIIKDNAELNVLFEQNDHR